MEILINGKAADITLENEKTSGDVLAALEQWLASSGSRISGLVIDGQTITASSLGENLGRQISEIKTLDLLVSSWPELAAEALSRLAETCSVYGEASFEERGEIVSLWKTEPASLFLDEEIHDIAALARQSFTGEGIAPAALARLAEERLREIANPAGEISALENLVKEISSRMEELPLDIQTGKDGRAAETMQLFSHSGEKIFRLLGILKISGLSLENLKVDGTPIKDFYDEFNMTLKDLLSAYENKDTVLAGDLIEYELAPRFLKLYNTLKEAALKQS